MLLLHVGEHRDAATGAEAVGPVAGGGERADHDPEVGATVGGDPAEGTGVRPARRRLDRVDDLHGAQLGGSGHRAGREERAQRTDRVDVVAQPTPDGADQLVHGLVGLHLHQRRHGDRAGLADHGQVVAEQVDDHQVLGAVLRVDPEATAQLVVGPLVATARGGALDRLGLDAAVGAHQRVALRARAEQPPGRARHVVLQESGIRRGVELAQPQVRRRGREVTGDDVPLGEVDLVAVAPAQLLLDAVERGAIGRGWGAVGIPGRPGIPGVGTGCSARQHQGTRAR
ncbi:unannotated protein [freshwater metagenome]|uniref:Unannotated protein n=1 Tax=freshwater metagenome TaxID=449393 RepID=A0A6J6RZP9_9ZZZZ